MRLEECTEKTHSYKAIFEGQEVEIMAAAFREHIFNKARDADSKSVMDVADHIGEWTRGDGERGLLMTTHCSITNVLKKFAEDTDAVIERMPYEFNASAFDNRAIPRRHRLGRGALKLAAELESTTTTYLQARELIGSLHIDVPQLGSGEPMAE